MAEPDGRTVSEGVDDVPTEPESRFDRWHRGTVASLAAGVEATTREICEMAGSDCDAAVQTASGRRAMAVGTMATSVVGYYDTVAAKYDRLYADPVSEWENANATDWLLSSGVDWSTAHIVDIGCGTGLLLDCLLSNSIHPQRYGGIDLSAGMVAEARRKFPSHQFRVGDARHDLAPETADVVVALFGVPSYCLAGMSAMLTVLRPGGAYFLMPYASRQTVRAERVDRNAPDPCSLPVRMLDAATAYRELAQCRSCEVSGLNACIDSPEDICTRAAFNEQIERGAPSCCRYLLIRGVK
jgi:SAM-dependent methyltransferase